MPRHDSAASEVDLVDDFVESGAGSVGGSLTEARGLWSRLKKSELIDHAIENAQAAQAGIEAGLRNEFRGLWRARKSKKMRGFTDVEMAAIKAVAQGNITSNVLRRIGSLGGGLDQGRNMLNMMGRNCRRRSGWRPHRRGSGPAGRLRRREDVEVTDTGPGRLGESDHGAGSRA